ncbi:MAG: DegT/DnrJ/EryC1/StrS family aminotransferase [Pseudomonadota bacterium]
MSPSAAARPAQADTDLTPIGLFDLNRQQARLRHDIDRRIAHVMDHGQFVLGPEVSELEAQIAEFSGVKHAIGVSSGRDALIMALMAADVGRGDAVFVPAFTFSATAAVVIAVGAVPVFVDVASDSFNMEPAALEAAIVSAARSSLNAKAIMPVDLFGRPADYGAISAIAAAHDLIVIADAAQSFGGAVGERKVGNLAPISCASFYPTKPLGAFGDGGAVLTDDDGLADAVRQIRTHGRAGDGDEAMRIGMTGRLDTIQAAVLLSKLSVFKAELHRRAEVAALYDKRLAGTIDVPLTDDHVRSAWALYTVRVEERDRIRAILADQGIGTGLFYRVALHHHPAFAEFLTGSETLPVAEHLAASVLSLPMGPDITDDEVNRVCDAILAAL